MNISDARAASRYAKAFCSVKGVSRAEGLRLEHAAAALKDVSFLYSPQVAKERKKEFADLAFKNDKLLASFIKVLIDAKRINLLGEISMQVKRQLNEKDGVAEAVVTYALEPDNALKKKILSAAAKILKAKEVQAEFKEDKSLVGGFLIKTPDITADASVKGRLERMKEILTK